MADEEGELPMFIEEEDEETEAKIREREKRREEGAKWTADQKWEAQWRRHMEGMPTQPPCRRLDPEEVSPLRPGRHLPHILGGPELASSANILSVKLVKSAVGFPIDLYGTVAVRDELDGKCVYVFRRDRDNCQRINSKDELLSLTGPNRGLLVFKNIFFEIDLKSKHDQANDKELGKWSLKDNTITSTSKPIRNRFVGKSCSIDLTYAPAHRAVEVTVEVKILKILRSKGKPNGSAVLDWIAFNKKIKEHCEFHGNITAYIKGLPENLVLYDSHATGCVSVRDGGHLELSRHVVVVPVDRMLSLMIASPDGHYNADYFPKMKGSSAPAIRVGSYKLELSLVWSALYSPKVDGLLPKVDGLLPCMGL